MKTRQALGKSLGVTKTCKTCASEKIRDRNVRKPQTRRRKKPSFNRVCKDSYSRDSNISAWIALHLTNDTVKNIQEVSFNNGTKFQFTGEQTKRRQHTVTSVCASSQQKLVHKTNTTLCHLDTTTTNRNHNNNFTGFTFLSTTKTSEVSLKLAQNARTLNSPSGHDKKKKAIHHNLSPQITTPPPPPAPRARPLNRGTH